MPLVVYLDETGDHSLEKIDTNFPIFALVMLVCDTVEYVNKLVPMVYQLKMDCFGHEGVIIHSRDIRKAQGDFGFLTNPVAKEKFYEQINAIIDSCDFKVISVVIKKDVHKGKYGSYAANPYDLSLEFAMERLLICLEQHGQDEVTIVAEARGKKEDDELYLKFLKIVSGGTDYYPADRFKKINFQLIFREKKMNIVGTQVADLIAYPTARFALNSAGEHLAFEHIRKKSSQANRGVGASKFSHKSKMPQHTPEQSCRPGNPSPISLSSIHIMFQGCNKSSDPPRPQVRICPNAGRIDIENAWVGEEGLIDYLRSRRFSFRLWATDIFAQFRQLYQPQASNFLTGSPERSRRRHQCHSLLTA